MGKRSPAFLSATLGLRDREPAALELCVLAREDLFGLLLRFFELLERGGEHLALGVQRLALADQLDELTLGELLPLAQRREAVHELLDLPLEHPDPVLELVGAVLVLLDLVALLLHREALDLELGLTDAERQAEMKSSPVAGLYDEVIDRESAYEILLKREEEAAAAAEKLAQEEMQAQREIEKKKARTKKKTTTRRRSRRMTTTERAVNTATRTITRRITDYVLRGILGGRRR